MKGIDDIILPRVKEDNLISKRYMRNYSMFIIKKKPTQLSLLQLYFKEKEPF
jgi:hypothetical protein